MGCNCLFYVHQRAPLLWNVCLVVWQMMMVAADPVRLHAVHRQTARVPQLAHSAAALLSPRSIVRRLKHPHAAAAGITDSGPPMRVRAA